MCIIVYVAMCYSNISVFIVLQNVETQGKGSKATNSVTSILSVCMCVCLCVFICALVCACCVHVVCMCLVILNQYIVTFHAL